MTPSMRRCSTAPALMDSPNFSPIGTTEGKGDWVFFVLLNKVELTRCY